MNRESNMCYDRLKGRIEGRLSSINTLLMMLDPRVTPMSGMSADSVHPLMKDLELDLQDLFRNVEPEEEITASDDQEMQKSCKSEPPDPTPKGDPVPLEVKPPQMEWQEKLDGCATLSEALFKILEDMSKTEFCKRLDISKPTLQSLLEGNPTRDFILDKLRAFGVPGKLLEAPASSKAKKKPLDRNTRRLADEKGAAAAETPKGDPPKEDRPKAAKSTEPPVKDSLRYKVWEAIQKACGTTELVAATDIPSVELYKIAEGKKVMTRHVTKLVEHFNLSSRYVADYLNDVDGKGVQA